MGQIPQPPLVLGLVGQTASGKNRLAVEAVEAGGLPLEIVSLDSMKVYRRMVIGTARPSDELRERVPHHLVDVVDPAEHFDAARWCRLAEEAERGIRSRGRLPFYVGGTGMYLQLLVHGHFQGPGADSAIRSSLHAKAAEKGAPALHARLKEVDPAAARRIHPNDAKRIVRALEVFTLTGKPISDAQQQFDRPRDDVRVHLFGLRWPADVLDERINRRCAEMIDAGWIEETRAIRESGGFGPQASQALGYREILDHLDGLRDREETVELVARRTRRFARRQMTWFKRFEIEWLDLDPAHHTTDTGRRDLAADLAGRMAAVIGG